MLATTLEVLEGQAFAVSVEDAAFLRKLLRGNFEYADGAVCIRRVVGHAVLPSGCVLRVRSKKTGARSILTWVAYCDPSLRGLQLLPPAEEAGEPGELAALTASLFAREVLKAVGRHGLARAYARQSVSSSVMRGRIDFAREARARGDRATIACLVWERTPETLLNRWLAAAMRIVSSDAVMRSSCARELPQLHAIFDGMPPLSPAGRSTKPPRPPRHLVHLEASLALASLIIRQTHLDEGAVTRGTSFFVNLESLFEATVVRAFVDAGVACSPKHPARYTLHRNGTETVGTMPIDLFCPEVGRGLVVDAKYKTSVSAGNLQQMVRYCHLTGAPMAVLVLPAGHLRQASRYTFAAPDGRITAVRTAELRTDARRIEDWRTFGRALVEDVLALAA